MLPPNFLTQVENQAIDIYNKLELQIIEEIAIRIANFGYANRVVVNDIMIAQEMGLMYKNIIKIVASYNSQSYDLIKRIFEEAGAKTLSADDRIYKKAGLNPVPIKRSRSIMQLLMSTIEKTNYNLSNLCMTTANTAQTEFYNAINEAYMETLTGMKGYSSAIIDSIEKISERGAFVTYPSGHQRSMESAIRTNIVTGINQTCGKLQLLRAEELNWDLMELTAHSGARPNHEKWQGKIVSRSGKKGYLSLRDIKYGNPDGFKGINCRHDWRPYCQNSSRTYSDQDLNRIKNEKIKFQGKEITKYEATQIQRGIERKIRQGKKDIAGINAILTNSTDNKLIEESRKKLTELNTRQKLNNSTLNNFLNETGLRKDYSRLKV